MVPFPADVFAHTLTNCAEYPAHPGLKQGGSDCESCSSLMVMGLRNEVPATSQTANIDGFGSQGCDDARYLFKPTDPST